MQNLFRASMVHSQKRKLGAFFFFGKRPKRWGVEGGLAKDHPFYMMWCRALWSDIDGQTDNRILGLGLELRGRQSKVLVFVLEVDICQVRIDWKDVRRKIKKSDSSSDGWAVRGRVHERLLGHCQEAQHHQKPAVLQVPGYLYANQANPDICPHPPLHRSCMKF